MEYKVIIFLMIFISVALGMFVGRFVLPRKIDGFLVVDDSDEDHVKWFIKLFEPRKTILENKHVYLDVAKRINEGDMEWPREK